MTPSVTPGVMMLRVYDDEISAEDKFRFPTSLFMRHGELNVILRIRILVIIKSLRSNKFFAMVP